MKMLQGRAKEMKRTKTAAVQLEQLLDLKNLALRYFQTMPEPLTLMPPSGTQLAAQQTAAAALPLAGPPSGTQLAKKAGRMGNNRKAPVPALQREPQVEPDSSDEEAERLELLGQQGK